jgi:undecaprenyl diphosphate synthase
MQSTRERKGERKASSDFHVAMIMDGNGRWATRRGLPRVAGHRAGVETVRRIAEAAPALGITKLTLFAFSSDNWRRPSGEVAALMALLQRYLDAEINRLIESNIRLSVIGRRDRLPAQLARASTACP